MSAKRYIALTYSKEITFQPFFSDLEIVLLTLAVAIVLTLMVALFRHRGGRTRQVSMPDDTGSLGT